MPKPNLQLGSLPPIFVSETHLDTCELHELEDDVVEAGGLLSYDLKEAKIVLTKAERKRRIKLYLRSKGCYTEEVEIVKDASASNPASGEPGVKKQKLSEAERTGKGEAADLIIDDVSTESETEDESRPVKRKRKHSPLVRDPNAGYFSNPYIKVLKLEWFLDCRKQGTILPIEPYLLYQISPRHRNQFWNEQGQMLRRTYPRRSSSEATAS